MKSKFLRLFSVLTISGYVLYGQTEPALHPSYQLPDGSTGNKDSYLLKNIENSGRSAEGITQPSEYRPEQNQHLERPANGRLQSASHEAATRQPDATMAAPSNDNCANAINLGTVSTTTTTAGTCVGATADLLIPSCFPNTYQNVWYKFSVPSGGGTYQITVVGPSSMGPEVSLINFANSCTFANSWELACGGYYNFTGSASTVTITRTCLAEGTYYIDVDYDWWDGGSPGAFNITVTATATGTAPDNDNCAFATNIPISTTNNSSANTVTYSGSIAGTNVCSLPDQGNTSCYTNNANVWYTFTPPVSGSYYVGVTRGTITNIEVAVFSGSCGSLTMIGCSGSSNSTIQPNGYTSSTYANAGGCNLTAGTTYYIMVDNYPYSGGSNGTFTVTVASLSNDNIPAAAIIAGCGIAFTSSTIGATNCNNCYSNNYNNLDCNTATSDPASSGGNTCTGGCGQYYGGGTSGLGGDVPYSVENDSWYQFCTTTAQTYSITFSPTTSTCLGPSTSLQMSIFSGSPSALTYVTGSPQAGVSGTTTYTISLAANGCSYIQVDGYAGTNCDYSITLNASPGCPLPIELLSFTGEIENNRRARLKWLLASEKDTKYFLVERSSNGADYTPIAKVASMGNTTRQVSYQAYDESPLDGENFYRLSVVSNENVQNIAAHTMVSNKSHLPSFTAFPNPTTGQLTISLSNISSSSVEMVIYDSFENKVWTSQVTPDESGTAIQKVDLSSLPAGLYSVNASDGYFNYNKKVMIAR